MENKTKESKSNIPEIGTKEFNDLASQYFGGKTKEKSTRQLALEWWANLSTQEQLECWFRFRNSNFTPSINPSQLTGREVENIWRKETQELLYENQSLTEEVVYTPKPNQNQIANEIIDLVGENQFKEIIKESEKRVNQKQFVEFNPELFKSYINKFSLNDKVIALLELCDSMNINQITSEAYKFGNIEYNLSSDDKDFVTFHKSNNAPFICDKLLVECYVTHETDGDKFLNFKLTESNEISILIEENPFIVEDWKFERSSGYPGYRNIHTGEWIYELEYIQRQIKPQPKDTFSREELEALFRSYGDNVAAKIIWSDIQNLK